MANKRVQQLAGFQVPKDGSLIEATSTSVNEIYDSPSTAPLPGIRFAQDGLNSNLPADAKHRGHSRSA